MQSNILIKLALIIFSAKILGALSKKFKQPPVIGLLILGIVLGPTALDLVEPCDVIKWIGQIGVLFLLFEAGLETDLKRIKSESKQAFLPAMGGILLPFMLGFGLSHFVGGSLEQNLVVAVIFTATSVSVSVMTLLDLGKLKGMEGRCIVNAAIIDDIIGIMLLTIVFGLMGGSGDSTGIFISFGKIVLFFVIAIFAGMFLLKSFFHNLRKFLLDNSVVSLAISVLLLYSWFAEEAGLAAITGAYFAGLFLGQTEYGNTIRGGISSVGKSFFVDVFFVGIGLEFNLLELNAEPLFLILFTILAILGKMVGSGLGAKINQFDNVRAFRIGAGMVPRGEVALIVANMAAAKGMVGGDVLSATILMVIFSAIFTPFLLKFGFSGLERKSFGSF